VSQLLQRGETVYSIPPSLTSQYRARRGRKKNDLVDAENVGRALLANPQLTSLHSGLKQRELQELTRTQRRLSEQLKASRSALQELMAESSVREIIQQVITVLLQQRAALEKQIRAAIQSVMPSLLKVLGVGPIVAGVLLAEAEDPRRLASSHHFASYCGAAPVERGSGQNRRNANQSWRESSPQLGSSHCRPSAAANGWRSIEEIRRQSAACVARRSALLSDCSKRISRVNYFESYNDPPRNHCHRLFTRPPADARMEYSIEGGS
jgi:hypothetical protein